MKRIKILAIIFGMLLVSSSLIGCNPNTAKKGKVNTAYYPGEKIWPEKDPDDYTAPDEMTVTVNGVVYTGRYRSSVQPNLSTPYLYHWYDGDGFSFRIFAETEQFCQLTMERAIVRECTFDAEQGRKIADAIADDYISLDEYTVTEYEYITDHSYYYCKKIDGVYTTDGLKITFDCSGKLVDVELYQLGAFANVKRVDIDEEQVNNAITEKLKKEYSQFSRFVIDNADHNLPRYLLQKTEAGQCVLHFRVTPYYKDSDGKEQADHWQIIFVVVSHEE